MRQLAADTRDPVATLVFSLLGAAGAMGLIPADLDPNVLAEAVGFLMGAVAAGFSFVHHRDFKEALRVGLEAREAHLAAPEAITDDERTPIDQGPGDAAE